MRGSHIQTLLNVEDLNRVQYTWVKGIWEDVKDDPRVSKHIKERIKALDKTLINLSADLNIINSELR